MEKETAHRAGAGNVEALATQDSPAPTFGGGERERERKLEKLRMIGYIGIYWHISSEPLGTSALKEGALVAVGKKELLQKRKQSHKKTPRTGDPGKEEQAVHR
jgi:hypothetical protein